jgi:hypothetical protein
VVCGRWPPIAQVDSSRLTASTALAIQRDDWISVLAVVLRTLNTPVMITAAKWVSGTVASSYPAKHRGPGYGRL